MLAINSIVVLLVRLHIQRIINLVSEFPIRATNCNFAVSIYKSALYDNILIESMLALDSKYCCVHSARGASMALVP